MFYCFCLFLSFFCVFFFFFFFLQGHSSSEMDTWNKLTHYLPSMNNWWALFYFFVTLKHFVFMQAQKLRSPKRSPLMMGSAVWTQEFYHYNGLLSMSLGNQALVWTVFKVPVKVHRNLVCAHLICTLKTFLTGGTLTSMLHHAKGLFCIAV